MTLEPLTRAALASVSAPERVRLIINRIHKARVVGLGGGRFPTASKLEHALEVDALVVNALQSEPQNNSDLPLLAEHPETTLAGVALAALVCSKASIHLALPQGLAKDLGQATKEVMQSELNWLNELATTPRHARQIYLSSNHGTGQEHYLAHELGLINKPDQSDLAKPLVEFSTVCLNLATCYAIAKAVYAGEPLTKRLVSVNGTPHWIEFGTAVESVLNPAWVNGNDGGMPAEGMRVDAGVFCISTPPALPSAPCINCGHCRDACPVNLLPDELHRCIDLNRSIDPELKLDNCIECGACNAVCPSTLWLAQGFRNAKAKQQAIDQRTRDAAKAKARVEARAARLADQEQQRIERLQRRSEDKRRAW